MTFYSSTFAQQASLYGTVSIQNSEYNTGTREYVSKALVSGDFSKDKFTDSEGNFRIEFVGLKILDTTNIKISKNGLEVVNKNALREIVVGRTPILSIYMCEKDSLLAHQISYHNISVRNLDHELNRRIQLLERGGKYMKGEMRRIENEFNVKLNHKDDAIQVLKRKIEEMKTRLPEFALKMAEVNLDETNQNYKSAYEHFLKGEINSALLLLNLQSLKDKGDDIISDFEHSKKQFQISEKTFILVKNRFNRHIQELELGAELSKQKSLWIEAVEFYETIVTQLESYSDAENEDIAYFSSKTGEIFAFLGRYPESLKYYKKTLDYHEQIYKKSNPKIADDYSIIGSIYRRLGFLDQALENQKEALKLRLKLYNEFHPSISDSYNGIAEVYIDSNNLDLALKYQEKALAIALLTLDSPHSDIARDYHDLARIQYDLEQYSVALTSINKSVNMKIELSGKDNLSLIGSYGLQGLIYKALEQPDKGLISQKNALKIFNKYYDKIHPRLPIIYHNLAATYHDLKILDTALITQFKAIKLAKEIESSSRDKKLLGILNQNLSDIHYSIGKQQFDLRRYQDALNHFESALEHHWNKADICNYSGVCFMKLERYPSARIRFYSALFETPSISRDIFLNNMGMVEAKMHNYKKALEYFEEYKERNPTNALTYRNYAMYYSLKNEIEMAIEMLYKAIKLGFKDIYWIETDSSLDNLRDLPQFQKILKKIKQ